MHAHPIDIGHLLDDGHWRARQKLFVFLTALAGSSALILTRQLGISTRMLATPTSVTSIVLGEGAGRWATATSSSRR